MSNYKVTTMCAAVELALSWTTFPNAIDPAANGIVYGPLSSAKGQGRCPGCHSVTVRCKAHAILQHLV